MGTATARIAIAAAALACTLAAAPAASAAPRYAGAAAATITSCSGSSLTAAASVRSLSARTRRPAPIRGARLELRLDAVPMFGLPRPGRWRAARSGGTAQQSFTRLAFDAWSAVLRYRFRVGRRTVLSGTRRSESRRVGSKRGRALCTLPEGAKPLDTRPPELFIVPGDGLWHRGPLTVTVAAVDDFSGVAQLVYRLDGGEAKPIRNGSSFAIATEGAHSVELTATDVAGNRSPVLRQQVLVDSAPPTAPVLDLPRSATVDTTPLIRWSASSDSGSGVQGYFVAVQRISDGVVVATKTVDAATTSAETPVALDNGQSYRATVTAFDRTNPAWTTPSAPLEFRVDDTPEVTGVSPGEGTILSRNTTPSFSLTLDRPADRSTLNGNVVLDRHPESGSDPAVSVSCDAACTTITVTPGSSLGEGRYALRLTSGVRSEEGTPFTAFNAAYSVAFFEDPQVQVSGTCPIGTSQTRLATGLTTTDQAEDGTLQFAWESTHSWIVEARHGSTLLGSVSGGAGSGSSVLPFDMPLASSATITFEFRVMNCGTSAFNFRATDVVGARVPRTPSFP